MAIPVYVFTGFLESGKTTFIQDTLCDTRFNSGERTLLLLCEEGEEEYDSSKWPHKNVFIETIEEKDDTKKEPTPRLLRPQNQSFIVDRLFLRRVTLVQNVGHLASR